MSDPSADVPAGVPASPAAPKAQAAPDPERARAIQAERQAARKQAMLDAQRAAEAAAPKPRPVAGLARIRRRHRGLILAFGLIVALPVLLTIGYMYLVAEDRFASRAGFTVRSQETGSASDLAGGALAGLIGGGTSLSNTEVLYAYIHSQEMVARVEAELGFVAHFQERWRRDPVFSLWPGATIEDMVWFWQRVVRVSYDQNSGLMDVMVLARTPEFAQAVAGLVVSESERMINALNEQARRDSTASALRDVEASVERLRRAREELATFRATTQIVDPMADIQGRMGVINNLQQQLAEALVENDLLLQTTSETDPRVRQSQRRIEVIEARINEERRNFATRDVTVLDTDYPRLIARFESLMVNQLYAEQTYTAALAALDMARSNAERKNLYLATYVRPTLAQRSEYPERLVIILLVGFFSFLAYTAVSIIFYSLRDRG